MTAFDLVALEQRVQAQYASGQLAYDPERDAWFLNGQAADDLTEATVERLNVAGTLNLRDVITTLAAAPTILAAPGWATVSTPGGGDASHDYVSPVTVGFLTGNVDENDVQEVRRCQVALSQVDYYRTDGGQVVGTDRFPAYVSVAAPEDFARMPIDEARVLHAVLGGLLARYDLAESPATEVKHDPANPLPCLPGCTEDHERQREGWPNRIQECHVYDHLGAVPTTLAGCALSVDAIASTAGPTRHAEVLIQDLPHEDLVQMTTAQTRVLAALLVAAADKADAIAFGKAVGGVA